MSKRFTTEEKSLLDFLQTYTETSAEAEVRQAARINLAQKMQNEIKSKRANKDG